MCASAFLFIGLIALFCISGYARPANVKTVGFNQRFRGSSRGQVYDAVVNYLFREGGGLSPSPKILADGDLKSGLGLRREISPIGLRERILDAKPDEQFTYTVENPNPFIYPTDYHLGTFSFSEENDGATKLTWAIDYIPMKIPLAGFIAGKISKTIGQIYLENLAKYLNEETALPEPFEN